MKVFIVASALCLFVAATWAGTTPKPSTLPEGNLDVNSTFVKDLTKGAVDAYKHRLPQNYKFELIMVAAAYRVPNVKCTCYGLVLVVETKRINDGKITLDTTFGLIVEATTAGPGANFTYTFNPEPPSS